MKSLLDFMDDLPVGTHLITSSRHFIFWKDSAYSWKDLGTGTFWEASTIAQDIYELVTNSNGLPGRNYCFWCY